MDANSCIADEYYRACFNPRARDGREQYETKDLKAFSSFNPRARDGRETHFTKLLMLILRFNPRARDGREY